MTHVKEKANEVKLYITEQEIFKNTGNFKTHRDFVKAKFRERGFEVTEFANKYGVAGQQIAEGLKFLRTDSDKDLTMIVVGTVGVNLRPLGAVVVDEKSRD